MAAARIGLAVALGVISGCGTRPVAPHEAPASTPVVDAPAPSPSSEEAAPSWWLEQPLQRSAPGFRVRADAIAPTLSEARRMAVARGLALLDRDFPGQRPEYRLTTWAGTAREGGYRVAVLIEADSLIKTGGAGASVRAGDQPAKDGP